jgi:N utilization substance protein B
MALNRREAREAVFTLLFETEFKTDEAREAIFSLSTENREIEDIPYVREVYFGVGEHLEELDEIISRHAQGWKVSRISRVSRSILRLCVYEMLYRSEIPSSVSINEAVELSKKFDEEKARPFVNGVLNSVKNEIEGKENA